MRLFILEGLLALTAGAVDQVRLLVGTTQGLQRRKTLPQRLVVSASSLCYLLPAVHASHLGDSFGASLFVLVAFCSLVADGSWSSSPLAWQRADKWTATTGGIYAIAPKVLLSGSSKVLCQLGMVTTFSFAFIVSARATPPSQQWRWIAAQSIWHVVSALALAWSFYCTGTAAQLAKHGCSAPNAFPFLA